MTKFREDNIQALVDEVKKEMNLTDEEIFNTPSALITQICIIRATRILERLTIAIHSKDALVIDDHLEGWKK